MRASTTRHAALRPLTLAALAAVLAGSGAAAGVFRPEPYPSWEGPDGVSQKLNLYTYYEEHEGLRVFVGTEVMRFHEDETYFPMQIAVGNSNAKPVVLTPEEFVLTDDQGVYYPAAKQQDIASEYRKGAFDQRMIANANFLGNKFVNFIQVPSLFYPNISATGVKNDHIELPKGTFLSDVLYFRKPLGALQERVFTLTVYFPQQERQMDVKFVLPGKAKKD
ncbi:MAG: hypothetical protein PVF68_12170 [Acidobacteriota bacterium]|jgi:hypothetical protein